MLAYTGGGAATFSSGALRDHFSVRRGGMSPPRAASARRDGTSRGAAAAGATLFPPGFDKASDSKMRTSPFRPQFVALALRYFHTETDPLQAAYLLSVLPPLQFDRWLNDANLGVSVTNACLLREVAMEMRSSPPAWRNERV